jgi:hypothetical protein
MNWDALGAVAELPGAIGVIRPSGAARDPLKT